MTWSEEAAAVCGFGYRWQHSFVLKTSRCCLFFWSPISNSCRLSSPLTITLSCYRWTELYHQIIIGLRDQTIVLILIRWPTAGDRMHNAQKATFQASISFLFLSEKERERLCVSVSIPTYQKVPHLLGERPPRLAAGCGHCGSTQYATEIYYTEAILGDCLHVTR